MTKDSEYYLTNGRLSESEGLWTFEVPDSICIAVDPKTAVIGVVGYGQGIEVFSCLNIQEEGGE